MTKTWKSDGPETKQVEKLFREGKFNAHTKPSDAQKKNPIFSGFTSAVFRKHFNLAKERCCTTRATNVSANDGNMTLMDLLTQQENEDEANDADGSLEPSEKKPRLDKTKAIEFIQAPLIPVVFNDPVTKNDKCLVVILSYNGVKGLNVDIVNKDKEKGQTLIVTYNWPYEMFNVNAMFKRDEDDTMMVTATHPKLLAVDQALRNYRENIEDAPLATIEIKLPVEVCADPKSWNFQYNKKKGGNVLIFIELNCVRHDYVICKNEKTITID